MKKSSLEFLSAPKPGDVKGFLSVGIAAGLKKSGKPDLGILFSDRPASAAGLFTTNRVAAAPVQFDRAALKKNSAAMRAVVVNSGHANAATGPAGMALARRMAESGARSLGVPRESILICSTGIIGDLPNEIVLKRGIEMAAKQLGAGDTLFQKSILTTDKVQKVVGVRMKFPGGRTATMVGVCKGSGMIAPNMATMLGFIVTDLQVPPAVLKRALTAAAADTFNSVSVDGDTSTNDTLLLLANGASGVRISPKGSVHDLFFEALHAVCAKLAWKLAEDGEGATKVVEVEVSGARTAASAKSAARTVAESLLVKTAMHGEDPNFGRILAALGRSGAAEVQPDRIDVLFNGVRAIIRGTVNRTIPALALRNALRPAIIRIGIDLHSGNARGKFISCDLSYEYVRINAEYHT